MSKIKYNKFSCDVCGSDATIKIDIVKFYNQKESIEVCKNCGFVFCQNRRDSEVMKNDWKKKIYKNKFDSLTYDSKNPAVYARLTYALEFLKKNVHLRGKTLCDVGAGKGEFIQFLRDSSLGLKEIYGVELSDENNEILENKLINCFNGGIEEFVISKSFRKFDIISLNWTLENTQSAKNCLEHCNKMLNSHGHLLISTGSRILVPFKKPLKYYIPRDSHLDIQPFRFSANSISALLNNAGFGEFIINRYIDTDYLCIIAKKLKKKPKKIVSCDDPKKIVEFFNRWHLESEHYE